MVQHDEEPEPTRNQKIFFWFAVSFITVMALLVALSVYFDTFSG